MDCVATEKASLQRGDPHRPRRSPACCGCARLIKNAPLGHCSITSTAVYTALAPNRFKDFWRD
jgi:hypothetical protein